MTDERREAPIKLSELIMTDVMTDGELSLDLLRKHGLLPAFLAAFADVSTAEEYAEFRRLLSRLLARSKFCESDPKRSDA